MMSTIRISVLFLLTALNLPLFAQPGTNRTILLTGNGVAQQIGAGFQYTLTGTGTLSGVSGSGIFLASGSLTSLAGVDNSTPVVATAALMYTNGDSLNLRMTVPAGYVVPTLGQPTVNTASMVVLGGSGALANASGTFTNVSVTINPASPSANFSASGTTSLYTPALRTTGTLGFAGSMGHLASGAGWKTIITLVNSGAASAQVQLRFFDDAGAPLPLPLTFPQGGTAAVTGTTHSQTIAAGSYLTIESEGSESTLLTGSAQLWTDGNVSASIIFRFTSTGQEAAVPLQVANGGIYSIPFDNTGGLATGIAVANVASQAATVAVTVRDEAGVSLASGNLALAAQGHTSFVIGDRYGAAAGKRGVIEFTAPAGGFISPIGIRASASGAFTTIPPIPVTR